MQTTLSKKQLEYYYEDFGDDTQTEHFIRLIPQKYLLSTNVIVDIGGGVGYFASSIRSRIELKVRILDIDSVAIDQCRNKGLTAIFCDALNPSIQGDEDVVCFNLVLHHLVGEDERSTLNMQKQALNVWKNHAKLIFINEYQSRPEIRT